MAAQVAGKNSLISSLSPEKWVYYLRKKGTQTKKKRYQIYTIIITIIYPLIARVIGAPQMISLPVSSIFPCYPLLSGTWRTPGLSIPWCCLPTSSSVCMSSSPFHCALQDGFGQTWWTGDMTIPLQFSSLYHGQVFLWSDCLFRNVVTKRIVNKSQIQNSTYIYKDTSVARAARSVT